MDILSGLVKIIAIFAALIIIYWILGFILVFTWGLLPAITGIVVGIWLWGIGHDNLAVIIIICGFFSLKKWWELGFVGNVLSMLGNFFTKIS